MYLRTMIAIVCLPLIELRYIKSCNPVVASRGKGLFVRLLCVQASHPSQAFCRHASALELEAATNVTCLLQSADDTPPPSYIGTLFLLN